MSEIEPHRFINLFVCFLVSWFNHFFISFVYFWFVNLLETIFIFWNWVYLCENIELISLLSICTKNMGG